MYWVGCIIDLFPVKITPAFHIYYYINSISSRLKKTYLKFSNLSDEKEIFLSEQKKTDKSDLEKMGRFLAFVGLKLNILHSFLC